MGLLKSDDQILAEIAALRAIKGRVREVGLFGNNNHEAIDAQIEVLADDLDHDEIYARWPDDEADLEVRDSALQAAYWRDGDENFNSEYDSPCGEWESLAA